jgi:prepilin-type N-terminal cleavage/methylation domain-containing protein
MIRSQKGFTLLEILVTLTLIVLVIAVAYPSLSRGTAMLSLRTTSRDILNTLRYAREQAVTEQITVNVTVDRENQSLHLTNIFGEGNRQYLLPETVRINRVILGGVVSDEGTTTIRFLPNGSSDTVEIQVESRTGSRMSIVSDPIEGGTCIRTDSREGVS